MDQGTFRHDVQGLAAAAALLRGGMGTPRRLQFRLATAGVEAPWLGLAAQGAVAAAAIINLPPINASWLSRLVLGWTGGQQAQVWQSTAVQGRLQWRAGLPIVAEMAKSG